MRSEEVLKYVSFERQREIFPESRIWSVSRSALWLMNLERFLTNKWNETFDFLYTNVKRSIMNPDDLEFVGSFGL